MEFDKYPYWAQEAIRYPIFGGDPGEEGAGSDGNGDGDGADGSGASGGKQGGGKTLEENSSPQLTPEQIAKLLRENNEAKANLSAFQKEKEEREAAEEEARRATASKEENLTKDVDRLSKENESLTLVNNRNLVELAILRNNKYQWHDPNLIAPLIDRSVIKLDATTGKVDGIEDELKRIAKDHPFLLKGKDKNEDNNGGGSSLNAGRPSGGVPTGGGDGSKATKRQQLEKRFPVLGR